MLEVELPELARRPKLGPKDVIQFLDDIQARAVKILEWRVRLGEHIYGTDKDGKTTLVGAGVGVAVVKDGQWECGYPGCHYNNRHTKRSCDGCGRVRLLPGSDGAAP